MGITMDGRPINLCWLVALVISQTAVGGRLQSTRSPHLRKIHSSRSLTHKDDPLRHFITNAVLQLPEDIVASETIGFSTLDVVIGDFSCFDLSYGEISIGSVTSGQREYLKLEIDNFDFRCSFNINWEYGWLDGQGSANVNSKKNHLVSKISTDILTADENTREESTCEGTRISIAGLTFSGDISLRVLNLYRFFIERIAENKVEEVLCEIMNQEIMGLLVSEAKDFVAYYDDIPAWRSDPLFLESSYVTKKTDTSLIDLQNDYPMSTAMKNLNQIYAAKQYDPSANTEDNMDYGINIILREKYLEKDGAFIFLDESDNFGLYKETSFVDVNVTVQALKIYGLDRASVLTPVQVIGNSTIETEVFWENVVVELNVTIEVKASAASGSYFGNADELEPIIENIVLYTGADNISAVVSLMVPIDKNVVLSLPKGYLRSWRDLPACIPPGLFDLAVSGLIVNFGHILQPEIKGVSSGDIDKLVQKGAATGLESFESAILDAVPNYYQTDGRDVIDRYLEYYHCHTEDVESSP